MTAAKSNYKRWDSTHPILILATSSRALAQAATAAGYRVRVADCYADHDTRQTVSAWVQISLGAKAHHWRRGVAQLLKGETKPIGILYGSGFENLPELVEEFSRRGQLLGNTSSCVRVFNDPRRFFPLLHALGIPTPETQLLPPAYPQGWLRKAVAGNGGGHILPAERIPRTDCYYQRRLDGRPGSVLFLANGRTGQVLGYNRLWTSPTPTAPYRYGGIAAPLNLAPSTSIQLQNYLHALIRATGLRGLNGLDFIQEKEQIRVLEVNPRPPASLDLYQGLQLNLLEAHIQACLGAPLPSAPLALPNARAFIILYAPYSLQIPVNPYWPAFCRDLPMANSLIERDGPICSVHAAAPSIEACQRLIIQRQKQILKWLLPSIR